VHALGEVDARGGHCDEQGMRYLSHNAQLANLSFPQNPRR
jgi:hypothetical protein